MSENPQKGLSNVSPVVSMFTTPLSWRGWPRWVVYMLSIIGLIYLFNPTAGIFEFIPDVIPGLGNLDEGVALLMIWAGVLEYFEGSKSPKPNAPDISDSKPADGSGASAATSTANTVVAKTDDEIVDGSWEEETPAKEETPKE